METVIMPDEIKSGEPQKLAADLGKFDKATEQVGLIEVELKKFEVVKSAAEATEALDTAKTASQIEKAIEEKRKQLVKPWNDEVGKINAYAKSLNEKLAKGIATIKTAVLTFQNEEKKRQQQALVTARQGQLAQLGFNYSGDRNEFTREKVSSISMYQVESLDQDMWNRTIAHYIEEINKYNAQQAAQLNEEKDLLEAFGSNEEVAAVAEKIQTVTNPVHVVTHSAPSASFSAKGTTKRWVFEIKDDKQIPREYLQVNETLIRGAINQGVREIPGVRIYQEESISLR